MERSDEVKIAPSPHGSKRSSRRWLQAGQRQHLPSTENVRIYEAGTLMAEFAFSYGKKVPSCDVATPELRRAISREAEEAFARLERRPEPTGSE